MLADRFLLHDPIALSLRRRRSPPAGTGFACQVLTSVIWKLPLSGF